MTHRTLVLGTLLAGLAAPAPAQDLAILNGKVHPVSGPPVEGATVVVRDGRIATVGIDVEVPEGVPRIDASGGVVTPGLFDPHSQIGVVEVDLEASTRDDRMADAEDPVTAAFTPVDGLNPRSTLIPYVRLGGLTTVATGPPRSGGLVTGTVSVVDLSGETIEEMVSRRTAAIVAAYGESGASVAGGSRGAAALRLREVLEDARFWRDNRAAFDAGRSRELAESRLDLEALQPVLTGEIPLVVRAERASDIETVLEIAGEYGIRPVILGGAEAWMVADRLAAEDVPVILKPLTSTPEEFERLGARFDNAARLHEAGVSIAFTTFENHRADEITQEAGNAVRFGLPWDAALEAITRTPARIYGVDDEYGSIEPGNVANLVVWPGDPLELSSYPTAVVIRGRKVPEWSRQRELLERYRTIDRSRAYRPGRDE